LGAGVPKRVNVCVSVPLYAKASLFADGYGEGVGVGTAGACEATGSGAGIVEPPPPPQPATSALTPIKKADKQKRGTVKTLKSDPPKLPDRFSNAQYRRS
jgi:hypothetical protein